MYDVFKKSDIGSKMNDSKDLKNRILQMREENSIEVSNDSKLEKKDNVLNKESKISENKESNKNNEKIISKDQEAFRVLANKFNDAVEVILELTTRVEKLETLVRLQSMQNQNTHDNTEKYKSKRSNLKYFILLIIIITFSYFIYFNKIDLTAMSEIFNELYLILKNS